MAMATTSQAEPDAEQHRSMSRPRSTASRNRPGPPAPTPSPPTAPALRCAPTASAAACSCSITFPAGAGHRRLPGPLHRLRLRGRPRRLLHQPRHPVGLCTPANRRPAQPLPEDAPSRRWSSTTARFPMPSRSPRQPIRDVEPAEPGEPAHRSRRRQLPVDGPGRRRHLRHPHRAGGRLVLQAQPEREPPGHRRRTGTDPRTLRRHRARRPQARRGSGRRRPVPRSRRRRTGRSGGHGRPGARLLRADRRRRLVAIPPLHRLAEPRHPRPEPEIRRPHRRRPRRHPDHRGRGPHLASLPGRGRFRPGRARQPALGRRDTARAWSSPTAPSPSTSPTSRATA